MYILRRKLAEIPKVSIVQNFPTGPQTPSLNLGAIYFLKGCQKTGITGCLRNCGLFKQSVFVGISLLILK